jgi:hypothetical protein
MSFWNRWRSSGASVYFPGNRYNDFAPAELTVWSTHPAYIFQQLAAMSNWAHIDGCRMSDAG